MSASHGIHCDDCFLSGICLPLGLEQSELDQLESIIRRARPYEKGECLYRAGEPFKSVYAVRSGSIKTSLLTSRGEQQVIGFIMPGEIVGLDGLADKTYRNEAVVMEKSHVCELSYDQLMALSHDMPALQQRLMRLVGSCLHREQDHTVMLGRMEAEDRLLSLLYGMALRLQRFGLSPNRLSLSMSRGDLANYLGIAPETISRLVAKINHSDNVTIQGRRVVIKDLESLKTRLQKGEA